MKSDQHFWNIVFSILYAVLLGLAVYDIYRRVPGFALHFFTPLDLIVIPLAVFRIVRLFTYDKIMQWFRDLFVRGSEERHEEGIVIVKRVPYKRGPLRTMSELLQCPWCTGVWAALAVVYLDLAAPWFRLPLFILAVAAAGSLLQLIANVIGWKAEDLKVRIDRNL